MTDPLRHSSSHEHRHSRTLSRDLSRGRDSRIGAHSPTQPRSPSPPSQTFHSSGILPKSMPTPALVESVAGGAHYSGTRVDPESLMKHRPSSGGDLDRRTSDHTEVNADHHRIMEDLKELYCLKPSVEIFRRSWHKDAVFEVRLRFRQ